ncbi:DUF2507 domain-containing protein [Geomicrobium sp. JSM 1781026]|uniref:DUF2507 domain-containing protein n=1 Tax=Geomicrobium sp. JSM 1781026 TaxID=3344580 RepID=UPI0035C06EC9
MSDTERKYTDFGYELVRETLLPELLNEEEDEIMYWGGKLIARKHPLDSVDDIPSFFERAGWGSLSLIKDSKKQSTFELHLMEDEKRALFSRYLEAGFIAAQYEWLFGVAAETVIEKKRRKLRLHVHIDPTNDRRS